MIPVHPALRLLVISMFMVFGRTESTAQANGNDDFYKGYYLQHAQGDLEAAASAYEAALHSANLDRRLQPEAERRLFECREDLAASDFARLMPPDPLAYIELNQPGARVRSLLRQLGLLNEDGRLAGGPEPRLAISPVLVDALLGIRGLAVAVTGFDPAEQMPTGVIVFHPGDMEVLRGALETALPVACEPAGSIGGFPTYRVENKAYVTLTQRLVIISPLEHEIENVVDRLRGRGGDSLADSPLLADLREDDQGELLFFFVNPQPLMPLLQAGLAAGAGQNNELRMAQALLDLRSLRCLSGGFDVGEDGIELNLALRLAEGHHNLAYNFLRGPGVDPRVLQALPADTAAFLTFALNPAEQSPGRNMDESDRQIVTFLDIGREIFANINGVGVYVLPPAGSRLTSADHGARADRGDDDRDDGDGRAGARHADEIPDAGLIFTVDDPAKSEALWRQMLGIASLAGGAPTIDGRPTRIGQTQCHAYRFEDGITVFFATQDRHVFVATTEDALRRSLEALRGEGSLLDQAALVNSLRLGPDTTLAAGALPARCMEIARQHMSPAEMREMEQFLPLLDEMLATISLTHSAELLQLQAAVTGLPDVSGVVAKALAEQRQRAGETRKVTRRTSSPDAREGGMSSPDSRESRMSSRDAREDRTSSSDLRAKSDALYEEIKDDAAALNNFAWNLLTEQGYDGEFDDIALRFARRSNELTDYENWAYLDTLALAEFKAGNVERAIELEEQAIERCPDAGSLRDLKAMMKRFRAGLE